MEVAPFVPTTVNGVWLNQYFSGLPWYSIRESLQARTISPVNRAAMTIASPPATQKYLLRFLNMLVFRWLFTSTIPPSFLYPPRVRTPKLFFRLFRAPIENRWKPNKPAKTGFSVAFSPPITLQKPAHPLAM